MRIGIAWRHFHERSGLPRYCTQLARRLARDDDVFLFARTVEVPIESEGVVTFPFLFKSKRLEYGPNTILNSAIVSIARSRLGLDIVNTQDATLLGHDVITAHGTWWGHYQVHAINDSAMARELRKSVIPLVEKWNYRRRHYRRIIVPSRLVLSELQRAYQVPEDDMTVVYDGVDAASFRPDPSRRAAWRSAHNFLDEIVLLHISTDFLRKGLWTLVRSLPLLPASVVLFVVGRENPSPYLALARELGVDRRIRFASSANPLEDFYNGCDLYVFPTFYESFGLTLLEAMACARPVVCTRTAGASELMRDGHDAILLDRWDDPVELAAKISYAIDSAVGTSLGRAARQTAEAYTWERTCALTRDVFEAAMRR